MTTRERSRRALPFIALLTPLVALLVPVSATAGELVLAWPEADDDLTTGYTIYVGTRPGDYDRSIDVGEASHAAVDGLSDEVVHYFAVKAYDADGVESPSFSPELVSLPAPRIDAIEPSVLAPGDSAYVTLRGGNFDSQVQIRLRDERLSVRSAVAAGVGQVILLLEAAPTPEGEAAEAVELAASSFLLVNPGRKADEYFTAHPEAVDLDASGWVDQWDVARVQASFGARSGDEAYRVDADVDGDGVIGGADLARLSARVGTPALWQREAVEPEQQAPTASENGTDGID